MEKNKYRIERGFAYTSKGQIHYAVVGQGEPILFLHQTPRSWDEYIDVLPVIGRQYRAIAMDTIGFGDSYRLSRVATIEDYAKGVIDFLDTMEIEKTHETSYGQWCQSVSMPREVGPPGLKVVR